MKTVKRGVRAIGGHAGGCPSSADHDAARLLPVIQFQTGMGA